ncbi:MAG: IS200/IS605 family transposase [Muribaculaceae bacterium]|nr:IS200/IS605 family transposase [Muribaculaceae bacterium]
MPHTSLLIHIVFATYNRDNTINLQQRKDLYSYTGGVIKNLKCKPLAIDGMSDHIHIFVDLRPSLSVSDFVKTIKQSTGKWIRDTHRLLDFKGWQEGYFAGTVGPDGKQRCINYIENQGVHHKGQAFLAEMEWLKLKYEIEDFVKNGTPIED